VIGRTVPPSGSGPYGACAGASDTPETLTNPARTPCDQRHGDGL
jgi:hypothetical protein